MTGMATPRMILAPIMRARLLMCRSVGGAIIAARPRRRRHRACRTALLLLCLALLTLLRAALGHDVVDAGHARGTQRRHDGHDAELLQEKGVGVKGVFMSAHSV